MNDPFNAILRALPSMDSLLAKGWVSLFEDELGRSAVKSIASEAMDELRKEIIAGQRVEVEENAIEEEIRRRLEVRVKTKLKPLVNATGVVVHTNLGRSPLAQEAIETMASIARSYSNLEYDLSGGSRGHRGDHAEWLLERITGAESALVVNNNAGAILLALSALAKGREVIVSRGELVEIGGSFRIPEILELSGAKLVEVGTTNRTYPKDYQSAITDQTALILKVHPSNYRIMGFTSSVPRSTLADLARQSRLYLVEDLGSGVLEDLTESGLPGESTVSECIKDGVDLVTFSGDKLLGGPQAGCIVGRRDLIDRMRSYPLLRALRTDKMTLAALEATLSLHMRGDWSSIPALAMVTASAEDILSRAEVLAEKLKKELPSWRVSVKKVYDVVGGGAFPEHPLEGYAVAVASPHMSEEELCDFLRSFKPPIICNVSGKSLLFHVRTLLLGDEDHIERALVEAWGGGR